MAHLDNFNSGQYRYVLALLTHRRVVPRDWLWWWIFGRTAGLSLVVITGCVWT